MTMKSLVALALGIFLLVCGLQANVQPDLEAKRELKDKSDHSIDYVDNDPEFLVGVRGIEKPLCFHTEGVTDQVVRLLQDPESGVIVNARIFHDSLTNKTYLGAIVISRGNFRILAKQRMVFINDARFDWKNITALSVDGHRVVVGEDMVAVTFRRRRITLVIRRHFAHVDEFDYDELDREIPNRPTPTSSGEDNSDNDNDGDDDTSNARPGSRADIMPVIGYEEREALINHFLSSKRRRSLILQNFFGINQDSAIVRNLVVEVDSHDRKRRDGGPEDSSVKSSGIRELSPDSRQQRQQQHQQQYHHQQHHHQHQQRQKQQQQQQQQIQQQDQEQWHQQGSPQQQQQQQLTQQQQQIAKERRAEHQQQQEQWYQAHRRRHWAGRETREVEDYPDDMDMERRRNKTIFLGVYIADSRDFSNRTHGLLGQFLFKNVTLERIRYKNGRMKARLLIYGNPSRRTIALLTLRRNMALNATRACWKIRSQGRDVIDGSYSDYLVPNVRYSNLKELPPPAPL